MKLPTVLIDTYSLRHIKNKKICGLTHLERIYKTFLHNGFTDFIFICKDKNISSLKKYYQAIPQDARMIEYNDLLSTGNYLYCPANLCPTIQLVKEIKNTLLTEKNQTHKWIENSSANIEKSVFYFKTESQVNKSLKEYISTDKIDTYQKHLFENYRHNGKFISTPDTYRSAKKKLRKSLAKDIDGPIAKHFYRYFSTAISMFLSRTRLISPNSVTTFVVLITAFAGYLMIKGSYINVLLSGFIFMVASILDCSDGEIARLHFKCSDFGAWYDAITDKVRYLLFFGSIGIGAYLETDKNIYIIAVGILFAALTYSSVAASLFTWKTGGGQTSLQNMIEKTSDKDKPQSAIEKIISKLGVLGLNDVTAFMAFIFSALYQHRLYFWLILAGTLFLAFSTRETLKKTRTSSSKTDNLIFFLIGIGLLLLLLSQLPLHTLYEAIQTAGINISVIFISAFPMFITATLSISVLFKKKLPFMFLFRNNFFADAYNKLLPLGGLGGEPYRIVDIGKKTGKKKAGEIVFIDRTIHMITNVCFAAITLGIYLSLDKIKPVSPEYKIPLLATEAGLILLSIVLISFMLINGPGKIVSKLSERMKFLKPFTAVKVEKNKFIKSLLFKLLTRTLSLPEIIAILFFLEITEVTLVNIISISAMLSISSVLFFFIPQGVGVNEASITAAFSLLGLPIESSLVFGLFRRARILFWAVAGALLHISTSGFNSLKKPDNHKTNP